MKSTKEIMSVRLWSLTQTLLMIKSELSTTFSTSTLRFKMKEYKSIEMPQIK